MVTQGRVLQGEGCHRGGGRDAPHFSPRPPRSCTLSHKTQLQPAGNMFVMARRFMSVWARQQPCLASR